VRREIANYLAAAQQMDAAFGDAIAQLEKAGQLENTVIIYTSDNGWQMPRGLANCHDSGSHVPLAVRWPGKVAAGSRSDAFINLTDFAATFLDIAGVKPWPEMTSRSFVDVLTGQSDGKDRAHVFLERERHANVRAGDHSYPCRAVRNADFLYIRNLRPDRWPAGELVECDPIQTTLNSDSAEDNSCLPVKFQSRVTELGMFELYCMSMKSDERWKMEFNAREEGQK
jgi:arylsulfatase A-like enzyme